ncbi:MAG TPA: hypothetical protein VK536_02735 [Candidatus Limnocylindrales bacterium]|nr:hypothetical protein [Candidatus Limnocylindrales bacterium]
MSSISDQEVDSLAEKIVNEVAHAKSTDLAESKEMQKILHLTNTRQAKTLLDHAAEAQTPRERDLGKRAVVKALLVSTWQSRLYFIIRSVIMGLLGILPTVAFILIFHSINFILEIPLGIFTFVYSLTISRLLDVQIVKATQLIINYLGKHEALRNFILDHF